MAKIPNKFSASAIERVFKEQKIKCDFNTFITALIDVEKKDKAEKAAIEKEESLKIHVEMVYPALKKDVTIEEFIEELIDERDDWYDHFQVDAEGGMDDDGEDDTLYYKVGDKFYEVEIHCEADWVGDWSVRANLPGDVSVVSIKEIENFEIVETKKNSVIIKKK